MVNYNEKQAATNRCARDRKLGVPTEHITLSDIANRYGYVCMLCGYAIPKDACGYAQSRATLDHIVPVNSVDYPGTVWGNVQLAHSKCNSAKGDMSMGDWWYKRIDSL